MRRLALAAILVLTPLSPADAALTAPTGPVCAAVVTSLYAEIDAGPLSLVDEDDPTVPHTGTITCSIQAAGAAHSLADWITVTGAPGTGAAVLPATVVPVPGELPYQVWTCTRLDVAGQPTLYWHDPFDRNVDGWWTTDPDALCGSNSETADYRREDEPVIPSTWATVTSTVSFTRTGLGATVATMPLTWSCQDVHTGAAVGVGSALTTPDPGVSCAMPMGCWWVQANGYLLPTALGRVDVTAACGTTTVTRRLTVLQGRVVEQWAGEYDDHHDRQDPLRCTAAEDTTGPAEPAYVVACNAVD